MLGVFSKRTSHVSHMEDPNVDQIRKYFRETVAEYLDNHKDQNVKLWVYVTGHSFKMKDESLGILLNDKVSLEKRANPYPLEATLNDLAADFPWL